VFLAGEYSVERADKVDLTPDSLPTTGEEEVDDVLLTSELMLFHFELSSDKSADLGRSLSLFRRPVQLLSTEVFSAFSGVLEGDCHAVDAGEETLNEVSSQGVNDGVLPEFSTDCFNGASGGSSEGTSGGRSV
jgi:hypothetical protein